MGCRPRRLCRVFLVWGRGGSGGGNVLRGHNGRRSVGTICRRDIGCNGGSSGRTLIVPCGGNVCCGFVRGVGFDRLWVISTQQQELRRWLMLRVLLQGGLRTGWHTVSTLKNSK
mmetsp:Transcript_11094/g.22775  ORF Transcript_11094/g.22775 Transcript_11094/m.22775 type:complete len:114 (-) Transcript_11094:31-372(-)